VVRPGRTAARGQLVVVTWCGKARAHSSKRNLQGQRLWRAEGGTRSGCFMHAPHPSLLRLVGLSYKLRQARNHRDGPQETKPSETGPLLVLWLRQNPKPCIRRGPLGTFAPPLPGLAPTAAAAATRDPQAAQAPAAGGRRPAPTPGHPVHGAAAQGGGLHPQLPQVRPAGACPCSPAAAGNAH